MFFLFLADFLQMKSDSYLILKMIFFDYIIPHNNDVYRFSICFNALCIKGYW